MTDPLLPTTAPGTAPAEAAAAPTPSRARAAFVGLGKWVAVIVGLVVVPQLVFAGYRLYQRSTHHEVVVELRHIESLSGKRLAAWLQRTLLTGDVELSCTTPVLARPGSGGPLWQSRCTSRIPPGRKAPVGNSRALVDSGWEVVEIRDVGAATEPPRLSELLPPWWLLLATAIPVLVLLRHDWTADLADRRRHPWRSLGWLVLPTAASMVVGVLGALGGVAQEGMMVELQGELAARPDWGLVAAIAVFAPLLEEGVFRGLAWRWLRPSFGAGGTLAVSSLAFVGLHAGQYGWFGLALVSVLALALATIRERTGSLLLCVGGHALVNALAVAAMWAAASAK